MIESILIVLKYILIVIGGYLLSVILKYILDKNLTRFRVDNYLIYLLIIKTPTASTKIVFKTNKRPKIEEIKKRIEEKFNLEQNEPIRNNSYLFRIRNHPTSMKIMITEPDSTKSFTISLETFSEDKLPKVFKSSFSETINYLEKITKELSDFSLMSINVLIKISSYFKEDDGITYNIGNISVGSKTISCSSNNFTDIVPLVKKCLRLWRNRFI